MKHIVSFFFYYCFILLGHSQQSNDIISYQNQIYTSKNGLSQVSINDIIQDHNGFIWLATQDGLNRFDGNSFSTFKTTNEAFCNNYIHVLLAQKDLIWLGSRAGLCFFDKKKNTYKGFETLQNYDILALDSDKNANIYATIGNKGIAVISKNINTQKFDIKILDFFAQNNIVANQIYIDTSNRLWVGTKRGKIFYADINSKINTAKFKELKIQQVLDEIFVLKIDKKQRLWIGTQKHLYRYNFIDKRLTKINFNNNNNTNVIYNISINKNLVWIATGSGLYIYNTHKKQIVKKYIHDEYNLKSISNDVVYSILIDKQQQVWIGTGKFLNHFYNNHVFHQIKINSTKKSLNSNIIFSIAKANNNLWVGTSGGGINLIKPKKTFYITKTTHNIPSNICFSLQKDQDRIWAGTREGVVLISNIDEDFKKMEIQNIVHQFNKPTSLSNNFVRFIYKDQQNNIWFCTNGGGLNRFTGNVKQNIFNFEHYQLHKNQNSIASNKVKYITQTDANTYWIATNNGVNILHFDNTSYHHPVFSRLKINQRDTLNKNVVYTLLQDHKKQIWIGTTKGLYRYNPKTSDLQLFDKNNGLPNNVIYAIMEDPENNIWVSTNKGISHLNTTTNNFTNFHQADGLASEEHDLHAKFIDKDSTLYFGGIDGITYFKSKNINRLSQTSKLYIKNIQISHPKEKTIENKHIFPKQKLYIKAGQFPFYVNFSDINLNYYKTNTFAYRLKPDDKQWNFIQDKRQIQFLSLAPGDYTLEIQGVNKNKIWKDTPPLSLLIQIIPNWWQSSWAYLFYVLLILLITYTFYRFILSKKLEHQENLRLVELDELKTKLYGNITHELRTPLTVILGMIETIKQNVSTAEWQKIESKVQILSRNSKNLLFLINQMLDLSKIESGKMKLTPIQADIVPFLKINIESYHSLANNKDIELIYYNENEEILMDFDPEKISIIISNLVTNAIKFTPKNGKIILHVKKEKRDNSKYLVIKLKDNGIGIPKKAQAHIFDRFYQVEGYNTGGTGIGLSLTKEIVELMHGTIIVQSKLHKGTEFIIHIPIYRKAKFIKKVVIQHPIIFEENKTKNIETHHKLPHDTPLLLIIEDNRDVADYIASGLYPQYEIIFAYNGQKGIEKALNNIPDLIITDLMMPVADGFEVCDILKNDEKTSHIPIIMLTARSMEKDKIKGLAHGADAYLTKPFNQNELFVRIEQMILLRKRIQDKYQKTGFTLEKSDSKEIIFIQKCIKEIHNHLDQENFKSAQLAYSIHLSESQLYRKIKAITNLSTAIFIREVRLEMGKEMLQKSNLNVSEIAYACGFSNPDWFSKTFKEKYGYTPIFFRKKNC